MFSKLINKTVPDNTVNGCKVLKVSKDTKDFPFCSDIIYKDPQNQIGIEFNWDIRIRIDGLVTTDEDSFVQMMDALVELSRRFGYDKLFFADSLTDDVLDMFLTYGFKETQVLGDPYNHYLDLDLITGEEGDIYEQ